MLAPVRNNPSYTPVARGYTTPAPIGGWNARDGLADMPEQDAVILDNFFPETSKIRLRRGFTSFATGNTGTVESLFAWRGPASEKLFAAVDNAIYNITAGGALPAADVSSLTSDRWQHVMFGTSGGNFLVIANGADSVRNYDGASWTTPTFTGVTSADLNHVNVHKRRLFFVEKGTLSFWYFPVETISGSISEFKLDALASLGGHLVAMGTWTRDSGDGMDDLAVFLTSEGECIIYQGTDPGDATKWSLIGVFRVGAPIGKRCMFKVGGELILITEDGFIPISSAIRAARTTQYASVSDKIRGAVTAAVLESRTKFGWQPILYPAGTMAVFNVPITEDSVYHQYVMNTTTGAWCRFKDQNGACWELHNDKLYFGGPDGVFKADTGLIDNTSNISGDVKTAFTYLGRRGVQKRVTMVRPVISTEGTVGFALEVCMDYEDRVPTAQPTYSGSAGSPWNTSPWNTSPWGRDAQAKREWQGVAGVGYATALRLRASMRDISLNWFSTDWLYEPGGYV